MNRTELKAQVIFPHIRWMVRADMPSVLVIENESFDSTWIECDFLHCLRHRNCIGMVAEYGGQVVGFVIYELHRSRLQVLNFAVSPQFRRMHVGKAIVDALKGKLGVGGRNRLSLAVRETNLAAQCFFRSQGFRAIKVLKDMYDDSDEDAYAMVYRSPVAAWCSRW